MNTKRKVLLGVYALVFVMSITGIMRSTSSQAEFTIKAAIQASTQDEDYVGLVAFKEYVESKSEGRVKVDIYTSGQFCGSVPECISNLQQGVLEMFPSTAGGTGNFFAPAQVLDLPYVFTSDKQAICVLNGPMLDKIRQSVLERSLKIRLLGIANTGGWRNFATTKKPIHSPED
jgi:TRAP-type C4-dicarboxylate transport system substrate-binding protein